MSGQRIIGLTGGIATGKTTVANFLHDHYGLPILDADLLARSTLNSARLDQVKARFGQAVFTATNELDRPKLAEIIFKDATQRKWLEGLIHPVVRTELEQGAKLLHPQTVMMVIPLLFEANMTPLVTEIWVVACSLATQIQRLMLRNHLSKNEALLRINAQMPLSEKLKQADVVLDSEQSLSSLYLSAVKAYWQSESSQIL